MQHDAMTYTMTAQTVTCEKTQNVYTRTLHKTTTEKKHEIKHQHYLLDVKGTTILNRHIALQSQIQHHTGTSVTHSEASNA